MARSYTGPELKELRRRAHLTQMDVVKEAGISGTTICYIERGERRPQVRTLQKLLQLYATRIQYWNNFDKVFEENKDGGNIPGKTAIGPGSPGIHVGGSPATTANERQVPVAHGLPRLPR